MLNRGVDDGAVGTTILGLNVDDHTVHRYVCVVPE